MSAPLPISDATEADLAGLLAIYNEVIATSTAIYANSPVTLEDRHHWWSTRTTQGYPVLVARDAQGVAGFASFGDFRAWPGYRFTVEHSVHVRAGSRGQGLGTLLVQALLPRAAALGKHVMIAGVDADNAASIRFHERLGFQRSGHLREVGYKFNRWLDLVFLQLRI
jgi:phosphinothricin acetyltransferase